MMTNLDICTLRMRVGLVRLIELCQYIVMEIFPIVFRPCGFPYNYTGNTNNCLILFAVDNFKSISNDLVESVHNVSYVRELVDNYVSSKSG